jgi:hypothetical protein
MDATPLLDADDCPRRQAQRSGDRNFSGVWPARLRTTREKCEALRKPARQPISVAAHVL